MEVAECFVVSINFMGFRRSQIKVISAFQQETAFQRTPSTPHWAEDCLQYEMRRLLPKNRTKSWSCTANHQRNQSLYVHLPLLPDPSVDLTHHKFLNQPSDPLIIPCYFCCGSLASLKNGSGLSCWVKHGFNNNTVTIWQSSWLPFATSEISTFLARPVTLRQLQGAVRLVKWMHPPLMIFLAKGQRLKSLVIKTMLTLTRGDRLRYHFAVGEKELDLLFGQRNELIITAWGNIWGVMDNCKSSDWEWPEKKSFHLYKHI